MPCPPLTLPSASSAPPPPANSPKWLGTNGSIPASTGFCATNCSGTVSFVRDAQHFPQRIAFTQAGLDCAAVACALERCRLSQGKLPDSLDALKPQLIDRLPSDIINGQPLKYRRTADDRFVLYSVGWNETDDGGTMGFSRNGRYLREEQGDWAWGYPEMPQPAPKSGS